MKEERGYIKPMHVLVTFFSGLQNYTKSPERVHVFVN
jgi:hypothetical protein